MFVVIVVIIIIIILRTENYYKCEESNSVFLAQHENGVGVF